jgi:hypothetical protein
MPAKTARQKKFMKMLTKNTKLRKKLKVPLKVAKKFSKGKVT